MKKIFVMLVIGVFTCSGMYAQSVWEEHDSNYPEPILGMVIDVVDENVAWTAGITGDYSASPWVGYFTDHSFSRTLDGGQTWQIGNFPSSGYGYFSDLSALNGNVAWLAYVDFNEGNKVFKTIDGGQTWETLDVPVSVFVNTVHFWDATSGFCMGDPDAENFEIFTTGNGGDYWQRVPPADMPPILEGELGLATFDAVEGDNFYFITNYSRIYHSPDKGYTWEVWNAPVEAFPDAMTVGNGGHCLVAMGDYIDTVNYNQIFHLYRTTNGGVSWEDLTPIDNNYAVSGLKYIPGSNNVVIGAFRTNNLMGPFETRISEDEGETWTTIDTGTPVYNFGFWNNSTGYASEYENNGLPTNIYKYVGNAIVGMFKPDKAEARFGVMPNPSPDGVFTVTVQSEQPDDFVLLVNDVNGKLISKQTFANTALINQTVDLGNLPAGMYSFTISNKTGHVTEKAFKVK